MTLSPSSAALIRAFVSLETKITPNLLREGVGREFVNRVQNIRKNLGFSVVDCVDLFVFCENKICSALLKNKNYISTETLAKNVFFTKNKPNNNKEVEINGSKVYIAIKLNPYNG